MSACSPTKNSFTRRAYHNVTAKYNALFNGKEAYKEAIIELNKVAEDDYSRILPIYKNPTDIQAQSVNSQLDKALMKSATVVQRHSFALRMKTNKEYCKWIDDCYLLIGKSYFAKQDFREAAETFDFISKEYNTPLQYDALLWQVRAKLKQNKCSDCLSILDMVTNKAKKEKFTKQAKQMLPLVYSEYYFNENQLDLAIDYLQKALLVNKKRKVKYRLNYILAQALQRKGQLSEAGELYGKVVKMNPPYVMSFNARINMAKCYDGTSGNAKLIKSELHKMLKDGKNIDFLDQIYHTLGEISLKEKDTIQAIDFFKQASAYSSKNTFQKAATLLMIADLNFSQLKYEVAQLYYDSTLQFIAKDHPEFVEISEKKELLTKLVFNIQTIVLEDSIQKIAKMPERERGRAIDQVIAELNRREQQKKQEENLKLQQLAQLKQQSRETNAGDLGTGGWYFYNTSALSFGYNEFVKKWGKRKLEDLWRLKDKKALDINLIEESTEITDGEKSDSSALEKVDLKDRNYYLKLLPLTDEALKKSDDKIMEAQYNVGYLYYEGLQDYPRSLKSFSQLIERFPKSDFAVKSYYYIYKIYLEKLKDEQKANYYKQKILTEFPNSDYAKILQNPDYGKEVQKTKSKQSVIYANAYESYNAANFNQAISLCDEGLALKTNDNLTPKFYYLKAISFAKINKKEEMSQILSDIVKLYPKHEIYPLAKNLLDYDQNTDAYLSGLKPSGPSSFSMVQQPDKFIIDSAAIHLFMFEVNITRINVNEFKNAISDYNTKNFALQNLTVSSVVFGKTIQIITVSNFRGIELAMKYYNAITNDPDALLKQSPENLKACVLTTTNYSTVVKNRNNGVYYDFFKANYIK